MTTDINNNIILTPTSSLIFDILSPDLCSTSGFYHLEIFVSIGICFFEAIINFEAILFINQQLSHPNLY